MTGSGKPVLRTGRPGGSAAGIAAGLALGALVPVVGVAPVLVAAMFIGAAATAARHWIAAVRRQRDRGNPAHRARHLRDDRDLTARRRPCPSCQARIPELARRCSHCRAEVEPVLDSFDEMLEALGD